MSDRHEKADFSPHTSRMWAGLEALEHSKELSTSLGEVEKELKHRIERLTEICQSQATLLMQLTGRVEQVGILVDHAHEHATECRDVLFGKDGLVGQFRHARTIARLIRWGVGVVVAFVAFAIQQGWIILGF